MARPEVEKAPTVYIYCLVNPIDGIPFYVGKTTLFPLERRLRGHIRYKWYDEGMRPEIKLLYKCKGYYEPFRKEIFFINKLLKQGYPLINRNLVGKKVPCK